MDFLQGPKVSLSSAIATALADFFVVDVNHIESNLLSDTKIILKDVRLKPQRSSLPENSFGKRTKICVTGFVREVSFTWSWESMTSSSKSWVKDAVLQIIGCNFKAHLTEEDIGDDNNNNETNSDSGKEEEEIKKSSQPVADVDKRAVQTIANETGIYAYLTKQIEMVMDALTLTVIDFQLTVEMPSPTMIDSLILGKGVTVFEDPRETGNIEIVELEPQEPSAKENNGDGDDDDYTVSIVVGGNEINMVSLGRYHGDKDEQLKEDICLSSLFINVVETFHKTNSTVSSGNESLTPTRRIVCKTYPLLNPFSYGFEVTRTNGKRFDGIGRGVVVKGGQPQAAIPINNIASDTTEKKGDGGLSLHLARPQMEGFGQLIGLVLAPREDTAETKAATNVTSKKKNVVDTTLRGDVSTFDFSIEGAVIDINGDIIALAGVNICYAADGTDLVANADILRYAEIPKENNVHGTSMTIFNIVASVRPSVAVTIGSVSSLCFPGAFELRNPVENIQARLLGETWTFQTNSLDGSLLTPEFEVEGDDLEGLSTASNLMVPFPVSCNIRRIRLVKDQDEETEVILTDCELMMNPKPIECSTELAGFVKSMESKLVNVSNINIYMDIPTATQEVDVIRNFALSLDNMAISGGYSTHDWIKTFSVVSKRPRSKKKSKANDNKQKQYLNIPYASVAPLKIRITYNAMSVMSIKETAFLVRSYKGNENTTVKSLIDFYTAECLARTPNFLQNADLLGMNIENAGVFGLGATLGFTSPIGPFVGVAAVVGVDAVRGSNEAGKRSRNAKEGEVANVGDFFRGIGYSAVEATQKGKLRRGGCQYGKGNIFDWMVGASANTSDYIGNNKDTIGSAGGAGAGVLVGTVLGGPVGAVIGGMVGGITTGTAIRQFDKDIMTSEEKNDSKHKAEKQN